MFFRTNSLLKSTVDDGPRKKSDCSKYSKNKSRLKKRSERTRKTVRCKRDNIR